MRNTKTNMKYEEHKALHDAECAESQRLYRIAQETKSDEDFKKWSEFKTTTHQYLHITLTLWPADETKAKELKKMFELGELTFSGNKAYLNGEEVGELMNKRASVWPADRYLG